MFVVVVVENALLFAAAQMLVILNMATFIWIVVETLEKFVENANESYVFWVTAAVAVVE